MRRSTHLRAVGESTLHRGVFEPAVQLLAARADVRLVFWMTSREVSIRQFIERYSCFHDARRLDHLRAGDLDCAWDRAEPLSLNLPRVIAFPRAC